MNPNLPKRPAIPLSYNSSEEGIYLHKGENPFPPPAKVLAAMNDAARDCNRYPDTNADVLREALAAYVGHGIQPHNIIVGNGSDELIDLAVVSMTHPDQCVVTYEPSFFVYGFCAARHSRKVVKIPREYDFQLPAYSAIQMQIPNDTALTFIANPNNPTGTLTSREPLLEYIQNARGKIIVDECYFEFCEETVADLVHEYPQLIVFRSLSKSYGLAGLRLGYAVAHEEVIETLNRHAMTFPVNSIAQAAGIAVLENQERYTEHIALLKEEREKMRSCFLTAGFMVPESAANFFLVLDGTASRVEELKALFAEHSIYISDQSKNVGRPALRIAAGTPEENFQVMSLIQKEYL